MSIQGGIRPWADEPELQTLAKLEDFDELSRVAHCPARELNVAVVSAPPAFLKNPIYAGVNSRAPDKFALPFFGGKNPRD
jgi:hypothetical protein